MADYGSVLQKPYLYVKCTTDLAFDRIDLKRVSPTAREGMRFFVFFWGGEGCRLWSRYLGGGG